MSASSRLAHASALRQRVRALEQQRVAVLEQLLELRELFAASLSVVYRTCGKKNCACTRGSSHGPYYFLSIQSGGRNERYHVSQAESQRMKSAINRYRLFVRGLRQLRVLDRNMETLLRRLQTQCETRSIKSFTTS